MTDPSAPALIAAISDSGLATYVRESEITFPVLQTFHALGIMLMVGTIAIVDLRILGVLLKGQSAEEVGRTLLPLTWLGFAVMLLSGGALLVAQSGQLYANTFLRAKLALLLVAGINVAIFHATTYRSIAAWGGAVAPAQARLAAATSLLLWAAVIVVGRYIAYY
ncbi:MAG: hypothetical protein DI570_18215 [Phenylobacterium zucineum]|nr:MAG: hypothetical protein DI570_18215 [Phenylobacterium zucineum]